MGAHLTVAESLPTCRHDRTTDAPAIAKIPGDNDYREPILKATLDAIWPVNGD